MDLDPIQTAHLVLHVIDQWLKDNGAGGFKSAKTIKDDPPKGYKISQTRYWKFCDDISATLGTGTGRKLTLKKAWRDKNYGDVIDDFSAAVTTELLNAPQTATGKKLGPLAATVATAAAG
jgi:hypothetical protein